jgi:Flp pilus assembly pilin Flp
MDRFNATLTRWFLELRDREEGQAAVEYGVLVALIIAVAIGTIQLIGPGVDKAFNSVVTAAGW